MKYLLTLILALVFILPNQLSAQNSVKELDKKTKKELKQYLKDPSSYRKMKKGYKDQIEDYEVQLTEVQEDFYKADYLRVLYYDSIQELNQKLAQLEAQPLEFNNDKTSGSEMYSNNGTDYRVQIGAYRFFDFTELLKFNQPIGFENVNGVIHYYLGSWKNPHEAYRFAEAIRKLKIDDAFVTKYVDGSRVPYDYLIEGGGTAYNQD